MNPSAPLPFATHEAFVEGRKLGRFAVSVRFDPRSLRLLDARSERVPIGLMIFSAGLVALAFTALAIAIRRPWLLVAIPMSWVDYRMASARLSVPQMFHWVVWWVLALPAYLISPALARVLFVLAPWFTITQFLSSAGKGIVHEAVLQAVDSTPESLHAFLDRGTIAILDTTTHTWYGDPAARPAEPES